MGAMQNNGRSPGKTKSSRGSVKNSDRLQAFVSGGKTGHADWAACDAQRIHDVVVGITALGGAVTFGLSRDMGSHSVTLMLDGKRQTLWFNGGADLDEELQSVIDTLTAIA